MRHCITDKTAASSPLSNKVKQLFVAFLTVVYLLPQYVHAAVAEIPWGLTFGFLSRRSSHLKKTLKILLVLLD